jgi:hypothetical protein
VTLKPSGEYSLTRDVGQVCVQLTRGSQTGRQVSAHLQLCCLPSFAYWEVNGDKAQGLAYGREDLMSSRRQSEILLARAKKGDCGSWWTVSLCVVLCISTFIFIFISMKVFFGVVDRTFLRCGVVWNFPSDPSFPARGARVLACVPCRAFPHPHHFPPAKLRLPFPPRGGTKQSHQSAQLTGSALSSYKERLLVSWSRTVRYGTASIVPQRQCRA